MSRAAARAEGRGLGHGARILEDAAQSDEGAHFDKVVVLDAAKLPPIVTWGSSPEDVISVTGVVPNPDDIADENKRASKWRALDYMGLKPGTKITDIKPSTRLHRLLHQRPHRGSARRRQAVVAGKKVAPPSTP
jgi:3-isopropylmalate/(R)-2-methylmalate dehydratase large subunit